MKKRKILTLIMVMVFLISFIGVPANASTTYVHHDCLEHGMPNYPGIHDVYVHYEDAILTAGHIDITWIDDTGWQPDTRYDVKVDVTGVSNHTGWKFEQSWS